jgi:hypothetical protein
MVIIAACSSSAHQLLDLLSDRCSLLVITVCSFTACSTTVLYYSVLPSQVVPRPVMLCRGLRAAKILSQWFEAERSRSAQGPGERPAPSREFQTSQAGMQVRTPARQPGPRVGLDGVPSRYKAKQAGFDRTLLAAYTGTHRGHTRDMLFGSLGHYSDKSTVSARLAYRAGTARLRLLTTGPPTARRKGPPTLRLARGLALAPPGPQRRT